MSVGKRGGFAGIATRALAALTLGVAMSQPVMAQSRTLATLADVPALVPAPYHAHSLTSTYSAALYDTPYYGGVYQGGGAHYWH